MFAMPIRSFGLLASLLGLTLFIGLSSGTVRAHPSGSVVLGESVLQLAQGGGCGSSCRRSRGASGGGARDFGSAPVGRPYWITTSQRVLSVDPGVSVLIDYVTNRDDRPLDHAFSYQHTTVRSVGFSGGYANYFRASIGGEVRRTETRNLTKRIDPWESLKIYTRLETTRYRVSGTQYQDLANGGRKVIEHASGPYTTSLTRLGYVTNRIR